MDIWLIRNGEKYGPFHDYDIRRRIEGGELDPESPAWHEGLAGWIPISEISIFKGEFQPKPSLPPVPVKLEEIPAAIPTGAAPPPLPATPKYLRRFWARWLDIHLYVAIWWLFLWATGRNIEAIFLNQWLIFTQLVPWFVIEILLIHWIATTPGKWLLGMRVLNADGSHLNLTESTRRALRVFVIGIGLGWSLVSLFCQGLSVWTAKRLGNPLWDHLGKHRVATKPLVAWRIILVIGLFFVALQAQILVTWPYHRKMFVQQFPDSKEFFEKNPQYSLPPRHQP